MGGKTSKPAGTPAGTPSSKPAKSHGKGTPRKSVTVDTEKNTVHTYTPTPSPQLDKDGHTSLPSTTAVATPRAAGTGAIDGFQVLLGQLSDAHPPSVALHHPNSKTHSAMLEKAGDKLYLKISKSGKEEEAEVEAVRFSAFDLKVKGAWIDGFAVPAIAKREKTSPKPLLDRTFKNMGDTAVVYRGADAWGTMTWSGVNSDGDRRYTVKVGQKEYAVLPEKFETNIYPIELYDDGTFSILRLRRAALPDYGLSFAPIVGGSKQRRRGRAAAR